MRIHLLGVAGSGMSGLATLLLEMGHRVSGSDRVTSRETERLQLLSLAFSAPSFNPLCTRLLVTLSAFAKAPSKEP